jgi:hypothetical protein
MFVHRSLTISENGLPFLIKSCASATNAHHYVNDPLNPIRTLSSSIEPIMSYHKIPNKSGSCCKDFGKNNVKVKPFDEQCERCQINQETSAAYKIHQENIMVSGQSAAKYEYETQHIIYGRCKNKSDGSGKDIVQSQTINYAGKNQPLSQRGDSADKKIFSEPI